MITLKLHFVHVLRWCGAEKSLSTTPPGNSKILNSQKFSNLYIVQYG